MSQSSAVRVEVACATPEKQKILALTVPEGTTARAAVHASGIQELFPGLDVSACQLGVFGETVPDSYSVETGDRIEIYRPLVNDPRDSRRRLASRGATMGKPGVNKN